MLSADCVQHDQRADEGIGGRMHEAGTQLNQGRPELRGHRVGV
jgi:hypothetical protein